MSKAKQNEKTMEQSNQERFKYEVAQEMGISERSKMVDRKSKGSKSPQS